MKKFTLVFIFLFAGFSVQAQFSYSVHAGWLFGEYNQGWEDNTIQGMESMTIGGQFQYLINDRFSVALNVNYQRQGVQIDNTYAIRFLDGFNRANGIFVMDYLRFPLLFITKRKKNRTLLEVGYGLGPGIRLGGYADMALDAGPWSSRHWSLVRGPLEPDQFGFRKVSAAFTAYVSVAFETNSLGAFGLRGAAHADWIRMRSLVRSAITHAAFEISLIYYLPSTNSPRNLPK